MTPARRLEAQLREWRERHKPICSECKDRPYPLGECARRWAPGWSPPVVRDVKHQGP